MIYSSPQINKYPWLVRIISRDGDSYNFGGFCGGTLVASKFVITAAHCLPGSTWTPYSFITWHEAPTLVHTG